MNPTENARSPLGTRLPGVLPKYIMHIVIGVIVALVIGASLFSGKRATKTDEAKPSPPGPSLAQLSAFKQNLERQRQEADELRKRLEAARVQDPALKQPLPVPAGASAPDPFEARRRERAALAPYASSFAVQQQEKKEEVEKKDTSSQIVVHVDSKPLVEQAAERPERSKESGKLLVAKEGNLYRLFEGTTVQTSLANRLDGTFTGPVLCIVTSDVRSSDGTVLLIPRGSKFIGRASRVEAQNQARLAVGFKRLLLPNGYSIDLDAAPGLDSAGQTGLKDKVDNHRPRTFGISGAIGLLGGLALYAGQGNPYSAGVANALGGTATNSLARFLNAVPTITIREGHAVIVYLPTDLLMPAYRP